VTRARRSVTVVAALAVIHAGSVGTAAAQKAPDKAPGRPRPPARQVVLAPLSTLGSESTAAPVRRLAGELEQALGQAGVKVIGTAAALEAIKQAKKPGLRSCDGDAACLAELGKLVGADWVVYGEVGGLGDVQVVYLQLVDAATGKDVRSTTLQAVAGDDPDGGARGAAVRLLAPERFVGAVDVKVDVAGAAIYVDGKRLARSPSPALELPVGTHALRVTHPEFRDFVRFVDVPFDRRATVTVALQQFPVVERDLESRGGSEPDSAVASAAPAPWYRSWRAIAGFGAVLLTGAAITAAIVADGTDADGERPVDPPPAGLGVRF
jgi:hypothetical protein